MRVFVYEYLCGEWVDDSPHTSLHSEGWAMLSAVLEDFAHCPGVRPATLLGLELLADRKPLGTTIHCPEPGEEEEMFRRLAADCAWTLVIAPEFDDILARRCRWVEESGGRLLGPSSDAVGLTADKLSLAHHWRSRGIPTPPTIEARPEPCREFSYPLVCKPRYGAGSQANFLVHDDEELARAIPRGKEWSSSLIVQPYCPGLAVSVSFLAGPKKQFSLPAVEQRLSEDGRFHYRGGSLPLPPELDRRARRLAEKAARTVRGLRGYFGVDLVLGAAADGSADVVIEINPRLTTSYVGLRRLARFNLAETLLALAVGSPRPCWDWRTEPIIFCADGRIIG